MLGTKGLRKCLHMPLKNEGDLTHKGSLTHFSCICLHVSCVFLRSIHGDSLHPLTTKSDRNLISPYKITSDSHIQVIGIKKMIIK